MTAGRRASSEDIGPEIQAFMRLAFDTVKPRWVVTVERKGTALIRTHCDPDHRRGHPTDWGKVISSEALQRVDPAALREGNFLVLDEGIYHGRRIQKALDVLEEKQVPRNRVKVAAFSVHEHSSFEDVSVRWFGELASDRYGEVRRRLIEYFQQQGSLLLDTEHIEVPVELNCGPLEFFDALCRAGVGVEHVSGGGQQNLTIYNPVLLDEADLLRRLPRKTTIRNVVRKIRVVERARNRYAIIPIFYPSVPAEAGLDSMDNIEECLRAQAFDAESMFHLVGVFAAINLFRTVFAFLRDLIRDGKISVSVPQLGDVDDSVSHLKVLFPSLDIEALRGFVERSVEAGRAYRLRRPQMRTTVRVEAVEGTRYGAELRRLHWLVLRRVLDVWHRSPGKRRGATLAELMQIGQTNKLAPQSEVAEALLSAAIDRAIDDADLIPDVSVLPFSDGVRRVVRTFKLDGELILSDVERTAALWRSMTDAPPIRDRGTQWM